MRNRPASTKNGYINPHGRQSVIIDDPAIEFHQFGAPDNTGVLRYRSPVSQWATDPAAAFGTRPTRRSRLSKRLSRWWNAIISR